jgi:putative transposase
MTQHYDPSRHHRQSMRLRGFNYGQAGAYFVTICAWQRMCVFGEIVDGVMRLNEFGRIVEEKWLRTPDPRPQCNA